VPGEKSEHKDTKPLRYVAIRIRKRQEEMFADGSKVKHFAIVSNLWELKPGRLIQWHREKAGNHWRRARRGQERTGGWSNAFEILRGECGLAAAGGD
jgi:hypothetical protein